MGNDISFGEKLEIALREKLGKRLSGHKRIANIAYREYKDELSELIWSESSKESRNININKIIDGKTKRIDFRWIPIICKFTGKDANYYFLNNNGN